MRLTRQDALGFSAAGALVLGVLSLTALPATAVSHRGTPAPTATAAVPHVELPGCALAIAADDDAANCDGGDHLIYRERYWVDADAPRVTAEWILMLGDTAYLRCAPGYDADPTAGPCWHPAEDGRPAGIVSGDEDEPIGEPITYLAAGE